MAVEVLVLDGTEEPLDLPVRLGALDAGADVAQLGSRADVAGELGGLKARTVIRDENAVRRLREPVGFPGFGAIVGRRGRAGRSD